MKRLYKSRENRIFAGIIGGIGEYLDIDPVILRILWVGILVFTGFVPGLIVYIVAIFIIPERPRQEREREKA